VSAAPVELRRPLGASEAGTWLMDRGAPLTFVLVARLAGELTPDVLGQALAALQARHPPLRARVVATDGGPAFTPDGVGPVPLRVLDAAPEAWASEAEDELVARFADAGPLLRATWLRHGQADGTLLLAFHHALTDGRGALAALGELVTAAGRLAQGRPAALAPSSWTAPLERCLPPAARGPGAALRRGLFVARTLWRDRRLGPALRVRRERSLPAHARRPRVCPLVLEPDVLQALVARARAEGTTLHGGLSAALLLAILADLSPAPGSGAASAPVVSLGTPHDIRDQLTPAPGGALGLLVSSLAFEGRVAPETPLWELARRIRRALQAGLSRGEAWSTVRLTPRVVAWLGGDRLEPAAFVEAWEREAGATCGVTNLGRLALPERCGPLSLREVHAVSAPSALTDLVLLAMTHAGQLRLNLMWPEPCLTRAHAERLATDVEARLLGALQVAGPPTR